MQEVHTAVALPYDTTLDVEAPTLVHTEACIDTGALRELLGQQG
ncbi:hypothetical protein [Litorihabitans aurantiacus]|uniref:Uncharacterized protein n=1 Tax=Litorihabitans aurantiacus TaxID=1930061 RepID=A0AA37XIG9_9MICO|nr:hypothetical protein [Litorihabitans aurantiacus]GMA33673.1 hypothetical protein GCM10025875_36650 [Litorihabitans aurantiacus]GMA33742.1 hypothetical protein GCM10025875_37340 [Litorihabitans aurantiacus]